MLLSLKRLAIGLLLALCLVAPARAQVFIVASCGTVPASQATLTAGNPGMLFIDTNGNLCDKGTALALQAIASGGWAPKHFIAANSDNATNLKASAGIVHDVEVYGIGSAPAYLKFYDIATTPTCGSTAVVKSIMIPAAATAANGAGSNVAIIDVQFANGIGYCVVTGTADTDDTSPAAATFNINFGWK